jgi:hypothetical protein
MRIIFAVVSVLGTLLFGAAYTTSFVSPARIESMAQSLLQREVEARVGQSLQALERSRIGEFAQRLAEQHPEQAEAVRRQLRERLVPYVEAVVAEMRDPNCPCRKQLAAAVGLEPGGRLIELLHSGGERLTAFIRAKYTEVAGALLREFRIFTGANALMFALLGVAVFIRRARMHVVPTAVLLLGATFIVGGLYLFAQNWLHTIVFGDYVGGAYFVYLAMASALLADLLWNRGRVNARIVSTFGGGAAAPC